MTTGRYALMALKGPDQPRLFILTQFPSRIGRQEDDHVRLSDPAVSRTHCEIRASDGALWLTVLSPDAPVTVDGTPVAQGAQAPLTANRSTIVVGGTTLALRDISVLLAKMEPGPAAGAPSVDPAVASAPVPAAAVQTAATAPPKESGPAAGDRRPDKRQRENAAENSSSLAYLPK